MDTKRIYRESRGSNYTGYNRASSRRKRSVHVKKLFVGIFSLFMILGLSAFYGSGLVSAHDNVKDDPVRCKYYKSIQIHSGDTLWNIAEEYITEDYESVNDYITEVNHQKIEGKKQLMDLVEHLDGEKVLLTVRRENTILEKKLTPVQISKGNYRLGIWVRDNVQGLGTITFLTKNNRFAALGHGIHDIDTSTLLTIKRGTLYRTSIQKVQKGSKGNPGTMEGIIVYNRFHQLGVIEKNTDAGIYGELNSDRSWIGEEVPIQVAKKEEIKTGEARIRCYIDGEVKEYTICITQIDKESDQVNKGMVIQVTDTELLEKTGGIIQGMSGSPIIQNGKLIGAVTHVFVQDSTKGYGIFIENMLKEEES